MPPLDFWTFLVLLLAFTIVFCFWLYARNFNGFDNYFEADVFVSLEKTSRNTYKVIALKELPAIGYDKEIKIYDIVTEEVFKNEMDLEASTLESALSYGRHLANVYNLEFRYHES